jgi:hypothetical protein
MPVEMFNTYLRRKLLEVSSSHPHLVARGVVMNGEAYAAYITEKVANPLLKVDCKKLSRWMNSGRASEAVEKAIRDALGA